MAKLNLGYTEGMNQDMGFDKRSPNQYYDAMNIKIINNGSNFCITNSNGEHSIDIPVIITDTDKGILGQAKITNGAVLFVHGRVPSNITPPITDYNYGYFLVPITDNDGELQVWPASPLFVTDEPDGPKESIGKNIDFVSIVEGNKDKIYFVDGENQMRIITINKYDSGQPYVEEISNAVPEPSFVNPFSSQPPAIIGGISIINGSSNLKYGEYQYFAIEATKNGITTNPSFISEKVIINKKQENSYQIKIDLRISNINRNLKYIYLYRIKYLNNDISIQLIDKQIQSNSFISFIDDGNKFLQEITLEEFNSYFKNINKPKTISSIYNRIVLGSIDSFDNFEFLKEYDTRAYSYILDYTSSNVETTQYKKHDGVYTDITIDSSLPYKDIDYSSVPQTSDCILDISKYKLFKEVFNDTNNLITEGAVGKNIKMIVEGGVDGESGSFVAGETYRFGIVFYDEYMNRSPVKWICDYTFPEYNPLNIINPTGSLRYDYFKHTLYNVKFELRQDDKSDYNILTENNIKYFDICYVNRTPENSNIVDFAICVPGFINVECTRKDAGKILTNGNSSVGTAPFALVIDNKDDNDKMANCNFITDSDFIDGISNNICLPYQIMKDIVVCDSNNGSFSVPVRELSSDKTKMLVHNEYFYLRGGRLDVDNDYGFDWDCANDTNYAPGLRSKIYFKKPTKANISYFYSPLISVGYVTGFTYIKPYSVLKNDVENPSLLTNLYNKTHISGSPWLNPPGLAGDFILSSTTTYKSYTKFFSTAGARPIFPFRTGWDKNAVTNTDDSNYVTGFNMDCQYNGYTISSSPTCTLFCPRSNYSNKWDQTIVTDGNKPLNYGYMSSYFVRQYFIDHNDDRIKNYSMYQSDYTVDDPFLYEPDFVQYESNGEYINYNNLRVSNVGKLADFYPVPWSNAVSDNSISDIQYMQLDCNYANAIATSFNYTFNKGVSMIKNRRDTSLLAVDLNKRYQILFQLRNNLKNQYGGNTYYNKINNSYIICTKPMSVSDGNTGLYAVYCQGDMKWGSFTIPRVWCNNDGGEDLLISNSNAALVRHNEFVTVLNVPTRIIDYDRNDVFTTIYMGSEDSSDQILNEDYNGFCVSSIKYDEKEILNISSSIYSNLELKEYFSSDFNNLITKYPTTLQASNVKIYNEEIENWAIFPVNEKLDLEGSYGEIIKVINHNGKLYAFQENGVAFISAQPRVLLETNDNIDVQLGAGKYFDRYEMLSTNSGIKHLNAVSGGYDNLYYIDANKNALFNLMNGNEEVSLSKGMFKYFNDNVSQGARCFYDLKERKLYVFLEESKENTRHNSLIYSEVLGGFETRSSTYPIEVFNINDHTLSYYNKDHSATSNFYELKPEFNLTTYPYIQFLVNPNGNNYIRYDVVEYTQQELDEYKKSNVRLFNIKNYYQDATSSTDDNSLNIKNKFSIFRITVPRDKNLDEYNRKGLRRIFSPQAFIKLQFDGTHHITSNLNLNFY